MESILLGKFVLCGCLRYHRVEEFVEEVILEDKEVLSESCEDYLLDIFMITKYKKIVRIKDVSKNRNVKMPAVTSAMKKLEKAGLISHEKYGYIELTAKGEEIAQNFYDRHKILYDFLVKVLNMDSKTAEIDAHKIEHDLGEESIKKISDFLQFAELMEKKFNIKKCFCFSYFSENKDLPSVEICKEQLPLQFDDSSLTKRTFE
jgi:DtxR family Mn-dependent transcriptional regulator